MFSPFLEEDYEKEDTLKQLEHQRKHLQETIITVQEKVKLIDKKMLH